MGPPCGDILRSLQAEYSFSFGGNLREQLLERVLRQEQSDFALAALLADRQVARAPERVDVNIALVQRAWESGIYIQRIHGLEFAGGMHAAVETVGPEAVTAMRTLLEGLETKDIFVNTVLLETLGAYGGLQLDIDAESAAREMRALIRPGVRDSDDERQAAELLEVEPAAFLASRARSCIDRIFEDVFQCIYWDAYAELSSAEKFDLLTLALSEGERDGMFLKWMLGELIKLGDPRAVTTCRRFASEVQAGSSFPLLRTNTGLAMNVAALAYTHLFMVEAIFRSMTPLLETRPIYHQKDETIRGHVFCSLLALVLRQELERRLGQHGWTLEWADIIRDLDHLQETTITVDAKASVIRSQITGTLGNLF